MSYTSKVGSEQVGSAQVGAGTNLILASITGVSGIPSSVAFGSGGVIGYADQFLVGVSGIPSSVAFGSGGSVQLQLTGQQGIPSSVAFGTTGAILLPTSRNITVFIDGVDRTAYVAKGVKRTWQIGSSGTNCQFALIGKDLPDYRPDKNSEVIIFEGTDRWFDGFVDSYTEKVYPGTNYINIVVNAVGYGAMLDRRYIGRHYIRPYAFLPNIVAFDLIYKYFGDTGLMWGGSSGDGGVNIGEPVFNWLSGAQALQQICDMCTWNYFVDMSKLVRAFPKDSGTGAAPFSLTDSGGTWISIEATKNFLPYSNEVLVRNSQDLQPLWTDTNDTVFPAPDGNTRMFATSSDLLSKPIIRVNGVRQTVVNAGVYNQPWDWYWLPYTVVQNFSNPAITSGDQLEIMYPSPISYVKRVKDDVEIAAHGLFQHLEEVQDVIDPDVLTQIATGLLDKLKQDVTELTIVTDKKGLEPGQLLTVNTALPPINDSFVIEEITSEEQGMSFFRHTVKASNATLTRPNSPVALFQKLLTAAKQPKDRTTYIIGWTLAETIPGQTNPGLTVSEEHPAFTAEKTGYARDVTITFRSVDTELTDTDIVLDIFQNGVSIFPSGNSNKAVFPAGTTAPEVILLFETNPLLVTQGDIFTMKVLQADAKAKDGSVKMTVLG